MSEKRITEMLLRLPALLLIKQYPGITTTEIKEKFLDLFNPDGKDLDIAKNRNDTYFEQKVRNLKSHNSISQYTNYSKENGWELNDAGKIFMTDNQEAAEAIKSVLEDTSFTYSDKIDFIKKAIKNIFDKKKLKNNLTVPPKVFFYDENEEIKNEGKAVRKSVLVRERSRKLRSAALKHFSKDGVISCHICGFNFFEKYGELGKGYIEIHHIKPIFQYENQNENIIIKKAMDNLIPVCSNCHRMLHRYKNTTINDVMIFD